MKKYFESFFDLLHVVLDVTIIITRELKILKGILVNTKIK